MPAVHAETLLAGVEPVGAYDLMQAQVVRRELGVSLTRYVEIPGATEVILGAGPTNSREVLVIVDEELQFALAPPAGMWCACGQDMRRYLPPRVHHQAHRFGSRR